MRHRKWVERHAQWADWHDVDTPWRHDATCHVVYSCLLGTTARRRPLRHRRHAPAASERHGPVTSRDAGRLDLLTSSLASWRSSRWVRDCRWVVLWRRWWRRDAVCDCSQIYVHVWNTVAIITNIIIIISSSSSNNNNKQLVQCPITNKKT